MSRHLEGARARRLVVKGRSAQWRPSRLDAAPLAEADAWMAPYRTFFEKRFARLEKQLANERKRKEEDHDDHRQPSAQLHAHLEARLLPADVFQRGPTRISSIFYKTSSRSRAIRSSSIAESAASGAKR